MANKWIGIGRLTRDPEVRYGSSGTAIAKYTLACDRKYKKDGQEKSANYINCVAFGKNAEFAEKYLKKGTKIMVEGHVQTGSYKNKEGRSVYTFDVIVEAHEFVESRREAPGEPEPDTCDFMNIPDGFDEELPF